MLDFPDNTHLSKWQVIQPQPQVILFRTFSITRVKLTHLQLLHFYLSCLFLHNFSVFGHYLWPVDVWKMETPQIADAGIMNKKTAGESQWVRQHLQVLGWDLPSAWSSLFFDIWKIWPTSLQFPPLYLSAT